MTGPWFADIDPEPSGCPDCGARTALVVDELYCVNQDRCGWSQHVGLQDDAVDAGLPSTVGRDAA